MELAVMVSLEELQGLQDAVNEKIRRVAVAMSEAKDRNIRVALADKLRVSTMLKAKLDVSFQGA